MEILNPHQRKLYKAFFAADTRDGVTIRQLARRCFPGVRPITKADSRVRNALRHFVDNKTVIKIDRGTYKAPSRL